MIWWILAVVAVVALVALFVLAGRAPRRRAGLDAAPAPEQTPGVHAPGPLTTDVDYGEPD